MKKVILLVAMLSATYLIAVTASAKKLENAYVEQYCKGVQNQRLSDGTWADCVTKEFAIEYDFEVKWAESFGQAQHYARMTGKKPAVMLILDRNSSGKNLKRLEGLRDNSCPKITIFTAIRDD